MIKFREFLSFVKCDDRGLIGGGGIIERIVMLGAGILVPAILIFPVRMVLPDSQIASKAVSAQTREVCTIGRTGTTVWLSSLEALGIKNIRKGTKEASRHSFEALND